MTNGLVPLTIRLFIGFAFVQLPPEGSSDTETVADTSCFAKSPLATAPVITEVIFPLAALTVALPDHVDVFALLHLMVEVIFIVPAVAIDAHVSFEAGWTTALTVPLVTPGVPLHAFNGSFSVIFSAVGTLLSPGATVARDCAIVQLNPLTALAGGVPSTPSEMTSETSTAKAAHRSHHLPP